MKKILISIAFFGIIFSGYSQIQSNSTTLDNAINGENPFFDLSTEFDPDISSNNVQGKGLVFPRTDLTSWSFVTISLDGVKFPTAFDGMIVYNTGTGSTPTTGNNPTTSTDVIPGFYYFSNPTVDPNNFSPSITDGQWLPLGGDSSSSKTEVVNNTINETTTIINGVPVNVVRLPGATNGTSTEMDLGTSILSANAVAELRKAIIYDNAGRLLLTATSDYNPATNVFVTGDGMVNKLLPEATDYVVELYFVPAVTP